MEKKNKNKIKDKISYKSFLKYYNNINQDKEVDSKINNELYINIDPKNYFIQTTKKDLLLVQKRIDSFKDNIKSTNEDEIKKGNLTKEIMKKFLDKLFPGCEISARKISYSISKDIRANKKLNRDTIEEYINYFFSNRYDLKYSTSLKFTKDFFINCGYILCYFFSKISENNFRQIGGIKNYINKVIENNINVIVDFYDYCTENDHDPSEMKKSYVWIEIGKKYEIPPEIIFLVNVFQEIDTLEFDIEFEGQILNEEDIKLFSITILNISYIFPKLEHININFINNKLQYYLYEKYYKKIYEILKIAKENIKKNKIKNIYTIYNKKWDFEHEFNLEEYRKNQFKKIEKEENNNEIIFDKYSILYTIELKTNSVAKRASLCNSTILRNFNDKLISRNNDDFEVIDYENDLFIQNIQKSRSETIFIKNDNTKKDTPKENKQTYSIYQKNNKNTYKNKQNSLIYDIILMILCGITRVNITKLDLLSNDFYNNDLIIYLNDRFGIDVISIDSEFHILDLLYNKTKNLDLLNIEINSLDILSFDKILGIIYKNQSLTSLKLSLFSSDVSYLIITLYKAYEEIKTSEEINNYALNESKNFTIDKFEKKIVDDIALCFIENINLLFEIIKNKNNLEVLGFNFDLPEILVHNMNYKLPIIKFILNIIFLIDNNESKNKNKIKKLTLLSPKTIFDDRFENNINDIFKDIKLCNNKKIEELNIQVQLYNIIYIKNIISTNLIKLSIGDLDIITFEKLVNYLTSYEFSSRSLLTALSIQIIKNIISFDIKVKLILRKLFNIQITNLYELKLFTNLIIKDKMDYLYLIKIIQNNWIPSYVIIFNENSKDILIKYNSLKKEIPFIASNSIQQKHFNDVGVNTLNKNKNNKKSYTNEEVFWILKYILYCRYSNYALNFTEIKEIIYSILKYLYLTPNINLNHKIEEVLKSN